MPTPEPTPPAAELLPPEPEPKPEQKPEPTLADLAVGARLQLSTLTWEQLQAAMAALSPPFPPTPADFLIQYILRPRLTADLPKLLQRITYWEHLLYPEVFDLALQDAEIRPLGDYTAWKIFREGSLTPAPPLQAMERHELPAYRRAARQWQEQVLRQRRALRSDLKSLLRYWQLPETEKVRNFPLLADQIQLEVTFHPIPPPPPETEPAALRQYRDLEERFQERHRRRLRERSEKNPAANSPKK